MSAYFFDYSLELTTGFVGRVQAHEAIEPTVQVGLVDFERAVGELVASAFNGAGPFEQPLQTRSEHRVAGLDCVFYVSDEVGEADLPICPRSDRKSNSPAVPWTERR